MAWIIDEKWLHGREAFRGEAGDPLVSTRRAIENGPFIIFIVDLPTKNGGFHSYSM